MSGTQPRQSVAAVQLCAVATSISPIVYAVVMLVMASQGALPFGPEALIEPGLVKPIGTILLVVGVGVALLSFWARAMLTHQLTEDTDSLQARMRITLICMAISNTPAIFGLVLALMAGLSVYVWTTWGISLAANVYHFPTRAWLETRNDNQ